MTCLLVGAWSSSCLKLGESKLAKIRHSSGNTEFEMKHSPFLKYLKNASEQLKRLYSIF